MKQHERKRAAGLTLREYYDRHHRPNYLLDVAPRTLILYRQLLDRWEQFVGDPQLAEIDNEMLAGFKARLRDPEFVNRPRRRRSQMTLFDLHAPPPARSRKPLAIPTVNKFLRHLFAILAKAGPPGPGNRDAMGILETMPWTRPLKERRRLPRDVTDDVLAAIYRATDVAIYPELVLVPSLPRAITPGDWWKALIITALTVGFRRGALLSLRWTNIDWQAEEIRAEAEDDKCGSERVKPVSGLVLKHLLRIRTDQDLVFAWPHAESTWYRQWRRIQDAGGIKLRDRIGLHDLKRACGTRFAAIASAWVVQKRLDHSSLATSQFYVNASREEREAVQRLPIPSVFREEFEDLDPKSESG